MKRTSPDCGSIIGIHRDSCSVYNKVLKNNAVLMQIFQKDNTAIKYKW